MVCHSEKGIGQTVITYIHHDIKVIASYGFLNNSLSFAGTKAGGRCIDNIRISLITGDGRFMLTLPLSSPVYQIPVHLISQLRTAL